MIAKNTIIIFIIGVILGVVASAVASSSQTGGVFGSEVMERQECEGAVSVLLQRKKEALDRRERTIKSRESDIDSAEKRLKVQFEELQSLRDEMREQMKGMDAQQKQEITEVVKMLQKMRGKQSAAILESTELEIAVEVVRQMDRAKAGAALSAMNPAKAAEIAQELTKHPINRDQLNK